MIVHWSFDPVAFALGPLAIRWYGLCWAAAFFGSEFGVRRLLRAVGRADIDVSALIICALAGTVVGARLAHCLFYDPAFYLAHPLRILAVWEGGMASHGGAVGLVLGLAWGVRRHAPGLALLTLLDVATISSALGAALIRGANFLNSEIVGLPTDGRWGVVFDRVDALPRHPVQLYEAGSYLLIAALLWRVQRRWHALRRPGLLTGWFMTLVFLVRIVLEAWKTPQAAYESGFAISVGQWLSVPFVVLGLALVVRAVLRPPAAAAAPSA
jgi:phosphatidylglycerol:prolipoprotein diacylglycerol transferase